MAIIKSTAPKPKFAGTTLYDLTDLRRGAELALAEARAEAERLVAEARREVERIFSESRESGFEQGQAEGYAAGLAEGRSAGEAAGRADARAEHEAMIKALEEAFTTEFMRWMKVREEAMRCAERELAGISIAIAESVVRDHVKADQAAVVRQVEQAVSLFARATRVSIEIAPEDEALVREALPTLCAALPPDADVSIRARAGIARGGCFIRSSEGTVDARIETQFRRMRDAIVGTDAPQPEQGSEVQVPPAASGPIAAKADSEPVDSEATAPDGAQDAPPASDSAQPPDAGGPP